VDSRIEGRTLGIASVPLAQKSSKDHAENEAQRRSHEQGESEQERWQRVSKKWRSDGAWIGNSKRSG